jgi:hypothetical protein
VARAQSYHLYRGPHEFKQLHRPLGCNFGRKRVHGKRSLAIATKFAKLVNGSSAILTWETMSGRKLVGYATYPYRAALKMLSVSTDSMLTNGQAVRH